MTAETLHDPQTFSSDLISVTVQRKKSCTVELLVSVKKPMLDTAREEALNIVSKVANISGFRKGKAPKERVIQLFAKDIEAQTRDSLSRIAYEEAQKLVNIPNLHEKEQDQQIRYSVKSFSSDAAELSFSFETLVSIPKITSSLFHLPASKDTTVSETELDEAVRQALFFFATWESITDRPVQEGDFVILDADVIEKEPSTPLFRDTRFEVTAKSMSEWMKTSLLGKSVGETVEGVSVADESASPEEKALFIPQKVRLVLKTIERPLLPERTEELWTKMGAKSEQDVREFLSKKITWEKERSAQEELRDKATQFLLETYPFDLPLSLWRNEVSFRIQQLHKDPEFVAEWDQADEERKKLLTNIVVAQAEKALRLHYISRQILREANLSLHEHELPPLPSNLSKEEARMQREVALNNLVLTKALDYIIQNGTPHKAPEIASPEPEAPLPAESQT